MTLKEAIYKIKEILQDEGLNIKAGVQALNNTLYEIWSFVRQTNNTYLWKVASGDTVSGTDTYYVSGTSLTTSSTNADYPIQIFKVWNDTDEYFLNRQEENFVLGKSDYEGYPLWYFLKGKEIILTPIPNDTYTIKLLLITFPSKYDLSSISATDNLDDKIPTPFVDLWVMMATRQIALMKGHPLFNVLYQDVERMKRDVFEATADRFPYEVILKYDFGSMSNVLNRDLLMKLRGDRI